MPAPPPLYIADQAASDGDVDLARAHYQAIADAGDSRGHFGLARLALARSPRSVLDVEEAVAALRLGAEAGDRRAMMHLAALHADLEGPVADIDAALVWYEAAADAGSSLASTRVGLIFADGRGVPVNLAAARAWLERAVATEDEPEAWLRLAHLHAHGFGGERDPAAAVDASIRGALAAQAFAARVEGERRALYDRMIARGLRTVRGLEGELRALADTGDADACYQLGRALATRFVELAEEGEHALGWYALAADAGSPGASWEVARAYLSGRGLPHDPRRAMIHLERAADAGVPGSGTHLGTLLERGDEATDRPPDPNRALAVWKRAAEAGEIGAMRCLGERDDGPDGLAWLERAAILGDTAAMRMLGARYASGAGASPDPIRALRWYLAALFRGDEAAREAIWPIAETLPDEAIAAAEAAADGNGRFTANYLAFHRGAS